MEFVYKKGTVEDIDLLTETRIEVLRAANGLSDDEDMSEVREQSYRYYQKALCDGTHIAYLVFEKNRFAGAGGVSFYQVMPTYHNTGGKKAYIMNMYTRPEYRRICWWERQRMRGLRRYLWRQRIWGGRCMKSTGLPK